MQIFCPLACLKTCWLLGFFSFSCSYVGENYNKAMNIDKLKYIFTQIDISDISINITIKISIKRLENTRT